MELQGNLGTEQLEYIERLNVQGQKPEYLIIWLHGLGADYNDFVPIIPQIKVHTSVKYVFPNAPLIPVTINNGHVMRAWYDIRDSISLNSTVDRQGINLSVDKVEQLIDSFIANGWKSERIIIAGFSQGGVIAYAAALKSKHQLCGVIALSCYLPNLDNLAKDSVINRRTPILACHGKEDMIVPYTAGFEAYNGLRALGFNIAWMGYTMDHELSHEEINDMSLWLQDRFII